MTQRSVVAVLGVALAGCGGDKRPAGEPRSADAAPAAAVERDAAPVAEATPDAPPAAPPPAKAPRVVERAGEEVGGLQTIELHLEIGDQRLALGDCEIGFNEARPAGAESAHELAPLTADEAKAAGVPATGELVYHRECDAIQQFYGHAIERAGDELVIWYTYHELHDSTSDEPWKVIGRVKP
jgi:hypothetical protein